MHFLHPHFFYALLALVIPVLLHLLLREKPRTLRIPTLEFIRRAATSSRRSQKLTALLLLALRLGLLLFLIFGLSRPVWQNSPLARHSKIKTALALVIDDNFYLQQRINGVPLIKIARKKAMDILALLAPGSKAACFTSHSAGSELSHDLPFIHGLINRIQPRNERGNLVRAINAAAARLSTEKNLPRTLVVLSDFNDGSLPDGPGAIPSPTDEKIILLPLPRRQNNVYIRHASVQTRDLVKNRSLRIVCSVGGNRSLKNKRVILEMNGRIAAEKKIHSENSEHSATVNLTAKIPQNGLLSGKIRLDFQDQLDCDNTWFFTARAHPPRRVLILGDPPGEQNQLSPSTILSLALSPPGWVGRQRFKIETMPWKFGISRCDSKKFDVVILTGRCNLNSSAWMTLQSFVEQGGGLLVIPGIGASLEALNAGMLPLLPGPIRPTTPNVHLTRPALGETSTTAPPHGLLEPDSEIIDNLSFSTGWGLPPQAQINWDKFCLLNWNNGDCAIGGQRKGRGICLFAGTPIAPSASRLLFCPGFAPLLHNLVNTIAEKMHATVGRDLFCGESFLLPANSKTATTGLSIVLPEKAGAIHLAPDDLTDNSRFSQTQKAGIYLLRNNNKIIGGFAANIQRTDRDYQYTLNLIAHKLPPGVILSRAPTPSLMLGKATNGPLPLTPLILIFLLVFLPFEAWIGLRHKERGRLDQDR